MGENISQACMLSEIGATRPPLLCMFTGSRITEIAQLRVDDIAERDGFTLVLVTHDEGKGQFIKNKKARLAVIHPILVEAGFVKFWQEQCTRAKGDGNKQLFPELKGGRRVLLGDGPSKWFRRYLTRIEIKGGADGFGSHSFRHTMADAMRAANYRDDEYGQIILGHSNNSITAAYGSTPQGTPKMLATMLNNALCGGPFAGVDFTVLTAARPQARPSSPGEVSSNP